MRPLVLFLVLCAVIAAGAAPGAGSVAACMSGTADHCVSPQTLSIARAESGFGVRMLDGLLSAKGHGTVVYSPLSIATALSMLGQGADGSTRTEFESALGLTAQHVSLADLALNEGKFLEALTPKSGAELEQANAIWIASDMHLRPAFADLQKQLFHSDIDTADFADPQTLAKINAWVSGATHGKIAKIVDSVPPQTRAMLVSALHFKGRWYTPFDAKLTQPLKFATGNGAEQKLVPGMSRAADLDYAETPDMQVAALPFADPHFEMVILLRRAANGAVPTAASVSAGLAALDKDKLGQTFVKLTLPRLKLGWSSDLLGILRDAGFKTALGAGANYGALSAEPFQVGAIQHAATFEADEEGAEGAAATAVVGLRSARVEKPVDMVVDHPFVFIVRERLTGAIIFVGYVADPGTSAN